MEYRSTATLLGIPLVHITTGGVEGGRYKRGIARGWIAVGDISFGVLLSVGGLAVGGVAFGGLAVGGFAIAGLALGLYALGGGAIGVVACGGAAIAWQAAMGGLAVAQSYAEGGSAMAAHANDPVAREFFQNSSFFSTARVLMNHSRWLLLLTLVPAIQGVVRRARQGKQGANLP